MDSDKKEKINIKGKRTAVDLNIIDGKPIFIIGKLLKIARIKDEICDDGIHNPEIIINELKKNKKADIFTFDQKLPYTEPKFNYYFEWDNFAVLQIKSFEHWWNKQIHNDARRMVRKAEKKGVVVKVGTLTNELISGIKSIYDETPIRQGKPFWHYKKDFNMIKNDNSSFLERSEFIGAYCNNELIGFEKIIYTGSRADPINLLSKIKDRNKAPTNALIAKSVEVCAQKGITYLTYGKYLYGKKSADSLSEFKKRNGFEKVDIPRYYIPLTLKGKIALKFKLHKGLIELLPSYLIDILLKMRTNLYYIIHSKELRDSK
ncbi:MAG: hypothetical protein ACFFDN_20945 [Candidatus Hodarchaeota archaeon]